MYSVSDYVKRGCLFLNNQVRPGHKKLASLMIYATDLCDSACKHCFIWTKRPVSFLPKEEIYRIVKSECVNKFTKVGLEGGEFLLHPEAFEILNWFKENHPNFDLLSNCLKPDKLIEAVKLYPPKRLWISLDGSPDTYKNMRGKDGYHKVINVIENLGSIIPISLMFTLSPFNDFSDLEHVIAVAKKYKVDLRVGLYNNIDFFDTYERAHTNEIGSQKTTDSLNYKNVRNLNKAEDQTTKTNSKFNFTEWKDQIPASIREFEENYDFLLLYNFWRQKELRLRCFSIFDNIVVLPNGDVPICQNLSLKLGNIYKSSIDEIINSSCTIKSQKWHSANCNGCWINYHRKQDVVLYRNLENFFGRKAVSKILGYYQWNNQLQSYKHVMTQ